MPLAIKIENVSKRYRLGQVGTGTLSHDLSRAWARLRGKEDPTIQITQTNDRTDGSSETTNTDYVWALNDINLEIERGEVLGIIGRNGAGKSTLLKLLSRVTAPSSGSIKTRGRIASLLEVGTGFHPELTGRENIYLNGAILGMRRHEVTKQLGAIVDFSGCAKYLDTPVKRYSSGMMVRLGFAVAAHLECETLIVDEVLAVGDAQFQKRCIGKMKDISSTGDRTVLFVSHNMTSVQAISTVACTIDNGTVDYTGDTNTAISRYLKPPSKSLNDEVGKQERRNADWGMTARIEDLEITGKNNSEVLSDQPIGLRFSIRSTKTLPRASMGITIHSREGTPLTSGFSDSFELRQGTNQIRLTIPGSFLSPGIYTLAASIFTGSRQGGRSNLDVVSELGPLEILPLAENTDAIIQWHRSYGHIVMPSIKTETVPS